MKMKTMLGPIFCLISSVVLAPALGAQDLSKYRSFSLGTNMATVLKLTDQKSTDVNKTHGTSAVFQELTWWPPGVPGGTYRSDSVEQILFTFYNDELFKISVTYDQNSTEGLTTADMVKFISEKYGTPATVSPETPANAANHYESREKSVATWEDSEHSLSLVRSSFSNHFRFIIYTKKVNADAELAAAEAVKLEAQEGPQREAQRQKKESDDLESARQKNRKLFRP